MLVASKKRKKTHYGPKNAYVSKSRLANSTLSGNSASSNMHQPTTSHMHHQTTSNVQRRPNSYAQKENDPLILEMAMRMEGVFPESDKERPETGKKKPENDKKSPPKRKAKDLGFNSPTKIRSLNGTLRSKNASYRSSVLSEYFYNNNNYLAKACCFCEEIRKKTVSAKQHLSYHCLVLKQLSTNRQKNLYCNYCSSFFTNHYELLKHCLKLHNAVVVKCTICTEMVPLKIIKKHKLEHFYCKLNESMYCTCCNFYDKPIRFINHLFHEHNIFRKCITKKLVAKYCENSLINILLILYFK